MLAAEVTGKMYDDVDTDPLDRQEVPPSLLLANMKSFAFTWAGGRGANFTISFQVQYN